MSFDSTCRRLAEQFPEDFEPIALNLLREGLALEVIARVSELSIEAVAQLQAEVSL